MKRLVMGLFSLVLSILCLSTAQAQEENAVIFVLDTSGSMKGAKIESSLSAVSTIVSSLPKPVKVGLTTFSSTAVQRVTPTLDREEFQRALLQVTVKGNTALYDGIALAHEQATLAGKTVLMVITDGDDTASIRTVGQIAGLDWRAVRLNVIAVDFATAEDFRSRLGPIVKQTQGRFSLLEDTSEIAGSIVQSLAGGDIGITNVPQTTLESANQPLSPAKSALTIYIALLSGLSLMLVLLVVLRLRKRQKVSASRKRVLMGHSPLGAARTVPSRTEIRFPTFNKRLQLRLLQDDIELPVAKLRLVQGLVLLGVSLVLASVGLSLGISLVLALPAALSLPRIYLRRVETKRRADLQRDLPDFLLVSASALRSGLPLIQAIQSAASNNESELGRQMNRAIQEVSLGASLSSAIRNVSVRAENDDLAWVASALEIQSRTGGNLSDILMLVAQTIKSRLELEQEIKTLTAEGLLSAKVLTALPVGMFCFFFLTNRTFVEPLWSRPLGLVVAFSAVGLMTTGYWWIKRISRLEIA